ncbi:chaplin family protein [Streptomyces sp. NPDC001530]|uniref:chaplin family protein n=1 Tax=Streptomyces sp. NPDC001530 TaxID=3364582 RepID=UPI0036736BA2
MRQGTRKGLMTVAAATGVIAAAGGYAHADSGASGSASNSPGVLSGNTVQVPLHVPVNVCGNTVNVVGALNPAMGNKCANQGGSSSSGGSGGARADGRTSGSPGVGSGNTVQVPIDVPVNACGNSVNVIGIGNPAMGNDCANGGGSASGRQTQPPGDGRVTVPPGGGTVTTPPGGGTVTVPPGGGTVTTPPGGGTVTVPPGGGTVTTPPGGGTVTTPPGDGRVTVPPGDGRVTTPPGQTGQPRIPHQPATPVHSVTPDTPPAARGRTPDGSLRVSRQGDSSVAQPRAAAQLAHTGSDLPIGSVLPVGAGALLAGAVLYRKARASA